MPARRTQGPSEVLPPTAAANKAPPDAVPEQTSPRYLLPKDLPGALKYLSDGELDMLFQATIEELKRRDRLPASPMNETAPRAMSSQRPTDESMGSLTKGKLNAVRAAFKAGVKPSAIARQFGVSQSDVRKALASDR